MCQRRTGDSTCGRACGLEVSIVAVRGLAPIAWIQGRSPRPVPFLSPFKELDPNLVSDNPTNRLERHHHTNPKNSTLMSFLLSLARYFPQEHSCLGRRISHRRSPSTARALACRSCARRIGADSFDQRWVRATCPPRREGHEQPAAPPRGLAAVSACSSATRNDSRAARRIPAGRRAGSTVGSRHSRRALTSCRRLSA